MKNRHSDRVQMIPYGHMVHDYYVNKVRALKRQFDSARINTCEAALNKIMESRKKILDCFGTFPAKTPLEPTTTGIIQRDEYLIEKVIFFSRPELPVTANLYLPRKLKEKAPGVIGTCGHSLLGKAALSYQAFCQSLASQGYVVLIYDPISQGERRQYIMDKHPLAPTQLCEEHNMLGNIMSLTGEWFGSWCAWDGIRALDYLLTRPEVDAGRIGVTGNSGGGTLASYLNALDERFTMAAPSCFVTTYERNIENELPQDSEQIPPGFLAAGLEMKDFFIAQAPRPVLLLGQRNDYFDPRGLLQTYEEIKHIYSLLGAEEMIEIFIGPDGHGYHQKNREAMYAFFAKHSGMKTCIKEKYIINEKTETLNCTKNGQTAIDFPQCHKVFDFTRDKASALSLSRPLLRPNQLRSSARKLLNVKGHNEVPDYRCLRNIQENGDTHPLKISRFGIETEPGIQTILYFLPPQGRDVQYFLNSSNSDILYVPHLSSMEDIENHEMDFVSAPFGYFSLDVRGSGESTPVSCFMQDFFDQYDSDFFYASIGQLTKTPYLGRKVFDVLSALEFLYENNQKKFHLAGRGLGAIVASFAALLSDKVERVTLKNALLSYNELTFNTACRWPLSHMLTDVLSHFDLPDIYRELADKNLLIIDPLDEKMTIWIPSLGQNHASCLGIGNLKFSETLKSEKLLRF